MVDRDVYLLELCRYIVLDPVRAGMIERPEDYPWSSCRATAGLSPEPPFLHSDGILAQLACEKAEARRRYMEFLRAGIGCGKIGDLLKSNAIPGGPELMAKLVPALRDKSSLREIPRSQRFASRPTLEEQSPPREKITKRERNAVLKKAHLEHGYSFAEIAGHVGMH